MRCIGEVFRALLTTPHHTSPSKEYLQKVKVMCGEVSFQYLTLGNVCKLFINSKKVRCEVFFAYFVCRIGILLPLIRVPSYSVTVMTELSPNDD